jgi:hypothetical protein
MISFDGGCTFIPVSMGASILAPQYSTPVVKHRMDQNRKHTYPPLISDSPQKTHMPGLSRTSCIAIEVDGIFFYLHSIILSDCFFTRPSICLVPE